MKFEVFTPIPSGETDARFSMVFILIADGDDELNLFVSTVHAGTAWW